jgi:hypothetical protein
MTRAQYAEHRGVSRAAITKAVQAGRIQVMDNGLIDVAAADTMMGQSQLQRGNDSRNNGHLPQMSRGSYEIYMEARARREVIEAARAQLRLDAEKGRLVEKAKLMSELFAALRAARDRILAFADRLAPELAAETDERRVYDKLFHECRMLCDELAEGLGAAGGNR